MKHGGIRRYSRTKIEGNNEDMNKKSSRIFSLNEAALAYALAAEAIFGHDANFLNVNPSVIPIFVSHLFQSLEISIKYAAIESGLFTIEEARERQRGSGHGIKELALFAMERLRGDVSDLDPFVKAMTSSNSEELKSSVFIGKMIYGVELEETRRCYSSRRLAYAEVLDGGFQIISPETDWIESVKQTATNLKSTIDTLSRWKASASKHFV